jgi:uncharacterized protein (DUF1778 family)
MLVDAHSGASADAGSIPAASTFPCKSRFLCKDADLGPIMTPDAVGVLDVYGHCPYTAGMAKVARATDRWEFRVEAQADEFVRRAADISNRTLTDFVVQAAVVEADRVLADRTRFVLEDEQWTRFVELLDRPPQENPGLTKLFATPSIFE